MADYGCHPLWEPEPDGVTNIDPASLHVPADLSDALTAWANAYSATLNSADPRVSGFTDEAAAQSWLDQGVRLAERLADEGFTVEYRHKEAIAGALVARD